MKHGENIDESEFLCNSVANTKLKNLNNNHLSVFKKTSYTSGRSSVLVLAIQNERNCYML